FIGNVSCTGGADGNAVFDLTCCEPESFFWYYDWDDANTPGNDVYFDDGSFGIYGLPEGEYYLIITDPAGCVDTLSFLIEPAPFTLDSVDIELLNCDGDLGSIQIVTYSGP